MSTTPGPVNRTNTRSHDNNKDGKVFINRKFYDADFSSRDLTHADFRGATLVGCNFDNSNLSYANFEGANCYRSTFRQARCYRTSFKDAVLAETILDPRDFFGATISVSCDTWDRMKIGKMWLASWLFLSTLGDLPQGSNGEDMKQEIYGVLNKLIGEERVKQLERHFANRQI